MAMHFIRPDRPLPDKQSLRAWRTWLGTVTTLIALVLGLGSGHVFGAEIDLASETDPVFPYTDPGLTVSVFSPRLKALWIEALQRPEVDLKRQAADAIAWARTLGMTDLDDTVPYLTEALDARDAHPVVRIAAVQALVALEAKDTAPTLMKHALRDGFDMAQLVEPVLAQWKYEPMASVWLTRLDEPGTPRSQLALAMDAVATSGLEKAAPALLARALDANTPADVRVRAARALGKLRSRGLEAEARRLLASDAPRAHRLVAVAMLPRHEGAATEDLLVQLAQDLEPAVAAAALRRLLEIQPKRSQPFVRALATSQDSGVRRLAVQALGALSPSSPELVEPLGALLDDEHREVRLAAQEMLIQSAATEALRPVILEVALNMLATEKPRGQEQAILVLGTLREPRAAPRFLVLLNAKHPQVYIAAAWGCAALRSPIPRMRSPSASSRRRPGAANHCRSPPR